jgi:acyl carrier protein
MNHLETVVKAASAVKLLDAAGKLVPLDSLSVLDLITEIETISSITIPTAEIRAESFESIETVAALLDRLAAAK